MHIACPSCNSTNRIPPERLQDGPACGKCGAELTPLRPVALGDDSLPAYTENTEQPVVIDFWAPWCGPCRVMAPHFEAAAKQLPEVRFVKVDSDENPRMSGRFGIRGIPTLVLMHGGREIARRSGAMPSGELVAWIRNSTNTGTTSGGAAS